MRKAIIFAIAPLALLAGCHQDNSAYTIHLKPKWQGAPYRLAFDAAPSKPDPAGITIPPIKYTANPDMLEHRASLVVRFEPPDSAGNQTVMNQVIMGPVDIEGEQGALPADYLGAADQSLASLLRAYHIKGKVKVSVLLARPLLSQAGESQIQANRLSDWVATDLVYTSTRPAR